MKKNFYQIIAIAVLLCGGISFGANPQVTLQISGGVSGTIVLEIYADKAPITAENFINYVNSSFYNGLIFHRVMSGFMVQGGGFDTSLVRKTPGAAIINENSNRLSNLRGTLAMARTSSADSATSEFFINHVDNTGLNYGALTYDYNYKVVAQVGYCVFGKVLSGMAVVDAIAAVPVDANKLPLSNIIIQSATVSYTAPVCATKLQGDTNGDCKVNLADLALLAQNWLSCNSILSTCN